MDTASKIVLVVGAAGVVMGCAVLFSVASRGSVSSTAPAVMAERAAVVKQETEAERQARNLVHLEDLVCQWDGRAKRDALTVNRLHSLVPQLRSYFAVSYADCLTAFLTCVANLHDKGIYEQCIPLMESFNRRMQERGGASLDLASALAQYAQHRASGKLSYEAVGAINYSKVAKSARK